MIRFESIVEMVTVVDHLRIFNRFTFSFVPLYHADVQS